MLHPMFRNILISTLAISPSLVDAQTPPPASPPAAAAAPVSLADQVQQLQAQNQAWQSMLQERDGQLAQFSAAVSVLQAQVKSLQDQLAAAKAPAKK